VSAVAVRRLRPRNETEGAILAAARQALVEEGYDRLTIDGIARRAFTSRTNVYFYFPGKRAVADRLVQQTFAEMLVAGAPYLEGSGEPRAELRLALTRVVDVVNRNADILLLIAQLSGADNALPPGWEPYIRRFVRAAEARIRADQERGLAPADISPSISARALCAMVERHVTTDVVRGGGSVTESVRVLSELWYRAVYLFPPSA
jgi:AcrR family transcriptional regulator